MRYVGDMPVLRESFSERLEVRVAPSQLRALELISERRAGRFPVARAVREALDDWIRKEGWRALPGEAKERERE